MLEVRLGMFWEVVSRDRLVDGMVNLLIPGFPLTWFLY